MAVNERKTADTELLSDNSAHDPDHEPEPRSLDDPALYFNREISLLAFQWRVFEEAQDESNPLLERFKFLSILGTNLEEFFMVRVAGLKRQLEANSTSTGKDGMTVSEQLHACRLEVSRLLASANLLLNQTLMPALRATGIYILSDQELTDAIRRAGGPMYRAFQRRNAVIEDRLPVIGGVRIVDRGAILVHPRLPAEEVASVTYRTLLPVSPDFGSGGVVVRGALHVRVPFASGTFDFFNTHLQSGSAMTSACFSAPRKSR